MNISAIFQECAPVGPAGVHYIWWEKTIGEKIYESARTKNILIAQTASAKVQQLIDNMAELAKHKFGAAVQLRIAEAVAGEICLAFRAVLADMQVDGKKLFPAMADLAWVNSHIKAEIDHHQQVKSNDGGMGHIASSFEEQQEMLKLAESCAAAWAGAMEDFEGFVREGFEKPNAGNKKMNRRWQCLLCDFVYDESKGWPQEGIAPGTAFEDIPDDWSCPECGVGKSDFALIEDPQPVAA